MLTRNFGFFLLMFMATALSYGQHAVHGNVVDAETEDPLPNASIIFNKANLAIVSDGDGMFEFESATPLISLVCELKGYQPYELLLKKRNVSLNIQMVRIVPTDQTGKDKGSPTAGTLRK